MSPTEMETYLSVPPQQYSVTANPRRHKSDTNAVLVTLVVIALVATLLFTSTYIYFKATTTADRDTDIQHRERFDVKYNEIRDNIINLENLTFPTVCKTNECYHSASALSNSMDFTIDPCDDFYNFACGQWNNDNLLESLSKSSEEKSQLSILTDQINNVTIDILREPVDHNDPKSLNAAKDYFKHCKDLDQLEKDGLYPMYSVLESYGGWPLLYENWDSSRFDFIKSISGLQRVFSTTAIFDIRVSPKGEKNVIELFQPSFLISQNILLDQTKYRQAIEVYLYKISSLSTEINASPDVFRLNQGKMSNRTSVINDVNEIIHFETKLAEAAKNLQTEGDSLVTIIGIPLKNMHAYFENKNYLNLFFYSPVVGVSLSLSQLLKTLFGDAGITLSDDQYVRVIDVDYVKAVLELLKTTPKRIIANYLHLRMAFFMAPETTKNVTKIVLPKNATVNDREKTCSSFVERNFGLAIAFKYIQNGFLSMQTKIDIQKMYENIMSSFKELVETTKDWVSLSKHSKLIFRVNTLKSCIGFPEWIENTTAVDVHYFRSDFFKTQNAVSITPEFLKKHLKITEWQGNQRYKKLLESVDGDCDWTFQAIVNAFYDTHRNKILLPPGILQFPLFDQNRPDSLNFGGLGTIIGHELTHSYYRTGINDSWVTEDKYKYTKKCLVDQYNSVESLIPYAARLNGEITLEENFCDVGGLSAAYYSLIRHLNNSGIEEKLPGLEEYDSEQLFYISFAQNWCSSNSDGSPVEQLLGFIHSPSRQRIIGALRNSNEFARAWKCTPESSMNHNSRNKCDIF